MVLPKTRVSGTRSITISNILKVMRTHFFRDETQPGATREMSCPDFPDMGFSPNSKFLNIASFRPNSPAPLTDNSSVNFHDVFFFIFAIIWQKMKKNTSWKFTNESSVTFQLSVSGAGEFGHRLNEFKVSKNSKHSCV